MGNAPTRQSEMFSADFAGELQGVAELRLREPLAATLGAFDGPGDVLHYTYVDVVKLAGHACPTTAAAYECCRAALARLYPGETPVRGEIEVTVYGEPDDGVYGVIGRVFSLITGAAPETGFKGLATFFRRKDLLRYDPASPDAEAMCFQFRRKDNGKAVLCRIRADEMPSLAPEDAGRVGGLLKKVLWEAATEDESEAFRALWRRNVAAVFESAQQENQWLTVEEVH